MEHKDNGWNEYEKLVIFRLEVLEKKVAAMHSDVMRLKITAASWGAAAGVVIWVVGKLF